MVDKQKHILFVSNTAFSLWNFRRHIIHHFKARGFKVSCMAASDLYAQSIIDSGIDFIDIKMSRTGINIMKEVFLIAKIKNHIKQIKPDLVVSYTIKPNSYVSIVTNFFNIPCVCVVTGLGYAFMQKNIKAFIARHVLKFSLYFAKSIWFLNKDDMGVVCGNHASFISKSDVINGEGIDTNYFEPESFSQQNNKNFIFLMISRIIKDKGIEEFVKASAIVKKNHKNVEFHVLGALGDAHPSAISKQHWDSMCKKHDIIYHGAIMDVRPYIQKADVSVLPSYREGLPLGLLESAAMGVPLIATDVAGCRDVIKEGLNGFLVKPRDEKDLAHAMIKMLEMDAESFLKMKKFSREDVCKNFDNDIIIKKYDELVAKIIGDE